MILKFMKSIENNFDNSRVNSLLRYHFIELRNNSPEGSTHVLDIEGLKVPSIKFWSIWDDEKLIGCGALKFLEEGHGEFKSIRISDEYRNMGYGIKLLNHLILESKKNGINKISLETGAGKFFKPARKLFEKAGFKTCLPFAHYKEDVNSCYYNKEI
tara:strand:- start:1044 stop:1514 length:471 start_codon:yes stop_codon:yes gene_type:complete